MSIFSGMKYYFVETLGFRHGRRGYPSDDDTVAISLYFEEADQHLGYSKAQQNTPPFVPIATPKQSGNIGAQASNLSPKPQDSNQTTEKDQSNVVPLPRQDDSNLGEQHG